MTPSFVVRSTPRYERLFRKLLQHQPELQALRDRVGVILSTDPYNRTQAHHIKKLEDVSPGEGQYRLRIARWRFRYDVYGQEVVLQSCGLRREDTYR